MQQLTFDHIIADFPHLVQKVKDDLDAPTARVVVWGTGLSATIAALIRKKFPHVVHGVWSSSGTFRAISPESSMLIESGRWNIIMQAVTFFVMQ